MSDDSRQHRPGASSLGSDSGAWPRDLATALRGLASVQESELVEHPELSLLVAYDQGGLEEDKVATIQDHLATCRECTQLLLDHRDFAGGETPDDAALEEGWDSLRSLLQGEDAEATSRSAPESRREMDGGGNQERAVVPLPSALPTRSGTSLRFARGLAAALFVLLCALAFYTNSLRQQVEQLAAPVANIPIRDVDALGLLRDRGASDPQSLQLGDDSGGAVLILNPSVPAVPGQYRARVSSSDGQAGLVVDRLLPSSAGNFTLQLPTDILAADSLVRIELLRILPSGEAELEDEFSFRVQRPGVP